MPSKPIPGSTGEILTCLPSPYQPHAATGLLYLPRFLAKCAYVKTHGALPASYAKAFAAIAADPNNELVVAVRDDAVIGVLQLTFIPYLTYQGGWRALVEGVRIDARHRSEGLGRLFFEWAIARATQRGCHLLQLTTDKARPEAKRFYESLGFQASHEGMKLHLPLFKEPG